MSTLETRSLVSKRPGLFDLYAEALSLRALSKPTLKILQNLITSHNELEIPTFFESPLSGRISDLNEADLDYAHALQSKDSSQKQAYCKVAICASSCCLFGLTGYFAAGTISTLTKGTQAGLAISSGVLGICCPSVLTRKNLPFNVQCFPDLVETEEYPFVCEGMDCLPCNIAQEALYLVPHKIEKKRLRALEKETALRAEFNSFKAFFDSKEDSPLLTALDLKVKALKEEKAQICKEDCAAKDPIERDLSAHEKAAKELARFETLAKSRCFMKTPFPEITENH